MFQRLIALLVGLALIGWAGDGIFLEPNDAFLTKNDIRIMLEKDEDGPSIHHNPGSRVGSPHSEAMKQKLVLQSNRNNSFRKLQHGFPKELPDHSKIDPNYQREHADTPLFRPGANPDLVHIIVTRFNQMQTGLPYLGQARFELFKTFTVPSIKAQSNQDFLWMIFTDPDQDDEILSQLMDILKDVPNAVLIGSNKVPSDYVYDDWIGQIERMFIGTQQQIRDYMNASKSRVFLESRLDADDSVFGDFVQNVQRQVNDSLVKQANKHHWNPNAFSPKQYRVFCAEYYLEWGYFNPWEPQSEKGHIVEVHRPYYCASPGLTYAYQVGSSKNNNAIPTKAHNKMATSFPQCSTERPINCIERISIETDADTTSKKRIGKKKTTKDKDKTKKKQKYKYAALRSRTPTSTAMQGVVPSLLVKENKEWPKRQEDAWKNIVHQQFHVNPGDVWALRKAFKLNLHSILKDALKGQCSKQEYGCKDSSIHTLKSLLAKAEELS